ncbi:MAG: chromosome segregation protein SMC [Acidobacteria bacterium]|nr:MAG: chromosome segregation protein SMC [Acidobacteriota bacterium]
MRSDGQKTELWRWVGPTLRRLRVRNYKSIGAGDVELRPLSVVVGRNGAGKSNLLDALAFVADAVRGSLAEAIAARGGLEAVRRRSTGHPRIIRFELDLRLPTWQLASYGFAVESRGDGGFAIRDETAVIQDDDGGRLQAYFARDDAAITRTSIDALPPPDGARLHLSRAASFDAFRPLYDVLSSLRFYRFEPAAIRALAAPSDGAVLAADGANLASVVGRLERQAPAELERIAAYLGAVVPGIVGVESLVLGPYQTLRFRQTMAGARHPWKLPARAMADGTLRALALLVAVRQDAERRGSAPLVGLETPETDLHPAAVPALVDALREAAAHTQILATSHSPELIDALEAKKDALLVIEAEDGTSRIAAAQQRRADHPTVGELLRRNQLHPAPRTGERQDQLSLFDGDG